MGRCRERRDGTRTTTDYAVENCIPVTAGTEQLSACIGRTAFYARHLISFPMPGRRGYRTVGGWGVAEFRLSTDRVHQAGAPLIVRPIWKVKKRNMSGDRSGIRDMFWDYSTAENASWPMR